MTGKSAVPRRLPPDGARKIIQFTNVEDIVEIPSYEMVDVSHDEIFSILADEEVERGCPVCGSPLGMAFFYVRGLQRSADSPIKCRCQHCFTLMAVEEGRLEVIADLLKGMVR
jgi:hypothetical protein